MPSSGTWRRVDLDVSEERQFLQDPQGATLSEDGILLNPKSVNCRHRTFTKADTLLTAMRDLRLSQRRLRRWLR